MAGKLTSDQFKQVLLNCGQFEFAENNVDMASIDYFRILDLDKDGFVGFFDFLQPLMSVIPQDVIAMFSQDQRFQQETFNELRIAFS